MKSRSFKLHELIEMAKVGQVFKASLSGENVSYDEKEIILYSSWSPRHVVGNWTIIKDPEVIKFNLDCTTTSPTEAMNFADYGPSRDQYRALINKKWRVVCTEIIE